ncbi:hypothetical protein [Halomicrobium salinisoli]|uniref:hypothetical protein n=1 Tax=Halomicrobium salinisoli TaxID=2878391 RepID=UPI001CF0527F|nr:hypothetical protein [Halomicrobium salinisoli]
MSEIEKGPTNEFELPATLGGLSLAAAVLSAANYFVVGEWAAGYGGAVTLVFALVGLFMIAVALYQ